MRAIRDVFVGLDGQFVFPELGCGFLFLRRSISGDQRRQWSEKEGDEGKFEFHVWSG
jgi:hypothetical protein